MVDAAVLASFLAPCLPFLVKGGEEAAKEAGKKFGGEVWERAQVVWSKLVPKLEARPAAREIAGDLAGDPEDADLQAALRGQLKKLLAEDAALAQELAALMQSENEETSGGDTVTQTVTGEHNKTVGTIKANTVTF